MLLKELKEGTRFEFVDKSTVLYQTKLQTIVAPTGVFEYAGVGELGCPLLKQQGNDQVVSYFPRTYERDVIVIH